MKRINKIGWEMLKFRATHPDFIYRISLPFIVLIIFVSLIYVLSQENISGLPTEIWVPLLLFFQLLVIVFQTFIINQQRKINRLQCLPKMVVFTPEYRGETRNDFSVYIKNLGDIAYNVDYSILLKKERKSDDHRKKLNLKKEIIENILKDHIYTVQTNQEILLKQFSKDDFFRYKIVVNLEFNDIFGFYHRTRFIKLPKETGFVSVSLGYE